jgi:phage gpG-like protein
MVGFSFEKFFDESAKVLEAAHRATTRSLAKAAYAIFRTAQEEITTAAKPSEAGQPPHTRKGQLRRAERYDVDAAAEVAVIGPRFSMVGASAEAHEFGGEFRGDKYPARPFMGPALERNRDLIPAFWGDEVASD